MCLCFPIIHNGSLTVGIALTHYS